MPRSYEGKHDRFLQHLKPLQGALEAYCRRSVRRSSEAEDVLQNAIMKAYRDFDRYAEGTNFRAWIFKYLNLEIYAGNRSIARHTHDTLAFEPAVASSAILPLEKMPLQKMVNAPEVILEHCETELVSAIWELNPMERSALLLHAIGNFKYREIADILDVPIGTVMSHLSRGRNHIREKLSEWSREHNIAGRSESESA